MSQKLINHPFVIEAKKILSEGDWAFETATFHIEHSGIEWRCHSNDGISFIVAIYEKEGEIFFLLDGTLAMANPDNRPELLSYLSEAQLTLPFPIRLGLRESNHGGYEVAVQCWASVDHFTLEGFKFRLECFLPFCSGVLQELIKGFGLEPFLETRTLAS